MKLLCVTSLLIVSVFASAQERADLTAPVTKTITTYEVAMIRLARTPRWELDIMYIDNQGNSQLDRHWDEPAQVLITALNKADLSVKSLERRALEHLIAEGKIPAATIAGSPR